MFSMQKINDAVSWKCTEKDFITLMKVLDTSRLSLSVFRAGYNPSQIDILQSKIFEQVNLSKDDLLSLTEIVSHITPYDVKDKDISPENLKALQENLLHSYNLLFPTPPSFHLQPGSMN